MKQPGIGTLEPFSEQAFAVETARVGTLEPFKRLCRRNSQGRDPRTLQYSMAIEPARDGTLEPYKCEVDASTTVCLSLPLIVPTFDCVDFWRVAARTTWSLLPSSSLFLAGGRKNHNSLSLSLTLLGRGPWRSRMARCLRSVSAMQFDQCRGANNPVLC